MATSHSALDSQSPTWHSSPVSSAPAFEMPTLAARGAAHYEHSDVLGRGGMGEVLLAHDRDLGREVAMKTLLVERGRDPVALRRFVEEARVTGQLDHPNIVPVHEFGVQADGRLFFTMPRVRGEDLACLVARIREGKSRAVRQWRLPARLRLFLKICEAMAYAHARGVIHRDLKPANVMVGTYGEVLVMDWGLARPVGGRSRSGAGDMTASGQLVGTPAYMAPEQARGEHELLDARADQFSLGAILLELCVLRRPVEAPSVILLIDRVARGDYDRPGAFADDPKIPRELTAVIERAMATDPEARYLEVGELAADVEAYLEGHVLATVEYTPLQRALKWIRRHPTSAAVGSLVLAGALTIGPVFGIQQSRTARLERDRAAQAEELGRLAAERAETEAHSRLAEERRRAAIEAYARALRILGDGPPRMTIEELALPLLETSARIDPDFHESRLAAAELHLALGNPATAAPILEQLLAVVAAEHAPEVRWTLARAQAEQGRVADARATAANLPPDGPEAAAANAWLALAEGKRSDAERAAGALIDHSMTAVEASPWQRLAWVGHWVLAQLHYDPSIDGGGGGAARAHLDRVVTAVPGFPPARVLRARLRLELGQRHLARADLDAAMRLRPDDAPVLVLRAELAGDHQSAEGVALYQQLLGRPALADDPWLRASLIRALSLLGRGVEATRDMSELETLHARVATVASARALALVYEQSGLHVRTPDVLAPLVAAHPQERGPLLCDLGRALFRLNRMDDAERALGEALAAEPTFVEATVQLARVLSETGRLAASVEVLERAVAAVPDDVRLLTRLATNAGRIAHMDRAWESRAREAFERARALAPEDAMVPIARGRFERRVERHLDAEGAFRHGIALAELNGDLGRMTLALDELGGLYEQTGEDSRGISIWNRLVALHPGARSYRERHARCTRALELESREPRDAGEAGLAGERLQARGDHARALPHFDRALAVFREQFAARPELGSCRAIVAYATKRARALDALRRHAEAFTEAQSAADLAYRVAVANALDRSSQRALLESAGWAYAIAIRAAAAGAGTDATLRTRALALVPRLAEAAPEHLPALRRDELVRGAGWADDPAWTTGVGR